MTSVLLTASTGSNLSSLDGSSGVSMPGEWPGDPQHHTDSSSVYDKNVETSGSYSRFDKTHEETCYRNLMPGRNGPKKEFFDPSSTLSSLLDRKDKSNLNTKVFFKPSTSALPATEQLDWRQCDPPRELLECQAGSSKEIKSLLSTSIERVQARHREERLRQDEEATQQKSMEQATGGTPPPTVERNNDTSNISASPQDYPESTKEEQTLPATSTDSEKAPTANSKSVVLGFVGNFFRRGQKVSVLESYTSSTSLSPEPEPETSTMECVSCLEDVATSETVKLICHSYCKGCFERLICTALESETQWPVKCCLNTIPSKTILSHLSTEMKRKYKKKEEEYSTPVGNRIYCTRPNCNTWISPRHTKTHINTARCPACHYKLCLTCRGPSHSTADCPQDPAIQATVDLAELEGWKRCYQCHALVEHNLGCRHMTCRCKAQFCYICSAKWQTCACTDDDLANIQETARTRRRDLEVRTARETAEEEEVREAIRLVEEFERAEAARLAREAEAERRKNEETRRRREERLMEDLGRFFGGLNCELESLHDLQKVTMAERYESESAQLVEGTLDNLNTLLLRQSNEIQAMTLQSEADKSAVEAQIGEDCMARVAKEKRTEDEYLKALRLFWDGKPTAEKQIQDALHELRTRQERDYKSWYAHRSGQLQALVDCARRKEVVVEASHACEIRAAEETAEAKDLGRRKRMWADERWAAEVMSERGEMLREMGQEAYTRLMS